MLLTWGYTVAIDTNRGEEPNNRPEPREGRQNQTRFPSKQPRTREVDAWKGINAVFASTGWREPQHRGGKTVQNRETRHQGKAETP